MKKIILAGSLLLSVSTTLFGADVEEKIVTAEKQSHWYLGTEYSLGYGIRIYNNSESVNVDTDGLTLKVGYEQSDYDKLEFQYTSETLTSSSNSSDKDTISEYKINAVVSIMKLRYKEMFIPYVEVALGYGSSDIYGGQLTTHLGFGAIYNPIDIVELSLGYRYSNNFGSTGSIDYIDHEEEIVFGAVYKF